MYLNCTEYKKITGVISGFILQLTLRNHHLLSIWCSIKKDSKLSEKTVKILLPFPAISLCETRFSSRTSTHPLKKKRKKRLNADVDMRIHLPSTKSD